MWPWVAGREFIAVGCSTHPKTWKYFTPELFVMAVAWIGGSKVH
jgi:hypothetical protein